MRRIKPNHGTEIPSRHLFFDTETIESNELSTDGTRVLQFRLVCAVFVRFEFGCVQQEIRRSFKSIPEFWDFVESCQIPSKPLHIWAHNLGFDLTIMKFWDLVEERRYYTGHLPKIPEDIRFKGNRDFVGCMVLEGRPCFIKAMGVKGRCQFNDLGNYLQSSLSEIGRSIGLNKLEYPGNDADDEILTEYCFRDVDIVKESALSIMDLWRKNDLGVWQATAGKLALSSWRHIELTKYPDKPPIEVVPCRDPEPDLFEREGYFGGRLECRFIGTKKEIVYHLDIQSHYPSVMFMNRFPTFRVSYCRHPCKDKAFYYLRNERCMARVYIKDSPEDFPVKVNGRLVFAKGSFWTTLCGPELQRAVDGGYVAEVREMAIYDLDFIFQKWVMRFWHMKLKAKIEGNHNELQFANMILRALSGKFAQGGLHWIDRPLMSSPMDWGQWYYQDYPGNQTRQFRAVAGNVQEKVYCEPPSWGFPAISAWITSHGREYLRNLILICPPKSVLHVATDSLHVTEAGFDALNRAKKINEDSLGFLAIKDVSFQSTFNAANDYRTDDRICKSGQWGIAQEDEKGKYWFSQWERLPQILKRKPDGTVKVHQVPIEYSSHFEKLNYGEDGFGEQITLDRDLSEFVPLVSNPDRWVTIQKL